MTRRALLTAALVATALLAAPAGAQDLTGTWTISSEGRRGPQTMTLELTRDGDALTGTVTLTLGGRRGGGGGGGGAQTLEIADGLVDGQSFSFNYTLTFGDNSFTQSYSGTWEGDSMEGTIQGGRGGGRPFTGTRGG